MPKSKKKVTKLPIIDSINGGTCNKCGEKNIVITGVPTKKMHSCAKSNSYFISLTFGDTIYEGSGVTVLDALQAMPVPVKIVSKGLLKLTDGTKKFEQMQMPVKLKRLFQPLSQAVQAKMLTLLLR